MKKIITGIILTPLFLAGCVSGNVGIIGGADGPTSIFLAQSSGFPLSLILLLAVIVVLIGVVVILMNRRDR